MIIGHIRSLIAGLYFAMLCRNRKGQGIQIKEWIESMKKVGTKQAQYI